jgi:hypothetical protein
MIRRRFASLVLFAACSAACNTVLGNAEPSLVSESAPGPGAGKHTCPGCAELSVPFANYGWTQSFEIYLAAPADLNGATVEARVRKVSANAGGVQLFAKNGAPNYEYVGGPWWNFSDLSTGWQLLSLEVDDTTNVREAGFDPSAVVILQIMLGSGEAADGPLTNPSVIEIDHVSVAGASVPAWTFDSNASALEVLTSSDMIAEKTAVANSRVSWVGP